MRPTFRLFLIALTALALSIAITGCGVADPSESDTSSTTEALTTVTMHVTPGTINPQSPNATLYEDPANPTPLLTVTTVISSITGKSLYHTASDSAIVFVTTDQLAQMNAFLAAYPGHKLDVQLAYNPAQKGTDKSCSVFFIQTPP